MARPRKNATPPAASLAERLRSALVPEEEQPYPVPANWCWVRLGSAITLHRGVSYNKHDAHPVAGCGDCLILRGGNIQEGSIDLDADNVYVNSNIVQYEQLLQKFDIVIVSSTGSKNVIGRAGISNENYKNIAFGAFLTLARARDGFHKKYIALFFQGDIYRNRIRLLAGGVNINNVKSEHITDTPFPLPPLAEQERIVERIETLFAKLDEAKARLEDVRDGHETRRAAILHKAFTGELTAKWREAHGVGLESWEERSREGLFSYVTSGSRGWAKYYSNSGSIFLRMGNLKHGTINIDMSEIQYVNVPTDAEGMRTRVQDGDILISITADVGMIGFMKKVAGDTYINQHIALARPAQKNTGEFISWYLVSDIGSKQLQKKQRGATKVGLSLEDIRSLALRLPTLPEQQEIVRLLDSLLAREERVHQAATQALEHIDLMKKAILARAFRGELGTNVPGEKGMGEG